MAEQPEDAAPTGQLIKGGYINYGSNSVTVNVSNTNNFPRELYIIPETSQYFHGREAQITQISEAIEERLSETNSFHRTIILVGFGGMGKSETAKAFAEKFHKAYEYIVWIDAQTQQSMEASFRKLADKLKIKMNSLADIPEIQEVLSNSYKKGLFIFDNAERLYTTDRQLGIEDCLYKEFLQNKPIFLATSRNGSGQWGGIKSKIKLINIDTLAKEEATNVLKNYLLIEKNTSVPESLENAISLLVDALGGYPLGLSLVGSTIMEKAEELSFEETESRIKAYTTILKDVPLQDISGEFKYEAALEFIYNKTIGEIKTQDNGNLAIELLNIMTCLDPDELYLGLVDAICSGTTYEFNKSNNSKNVNVIKGFKILMDYSIVKKYDSDRLQIHRLIQQCTRKAQTSQEAMSKICRFFELNEYNMNGRGHIVTLIDMLSARTTIDNRSYFMCLLVWRYCLEEQNFQFENIQKCKSCFNFEKSDESFMFKLAEIYWSWNRKSGWSTVNWEEIETETLGLSQHLSSQFWVTRALLTFLEECLIYKMPLMPSTRDKISSYIINRCLDFQLEKLEVLIEKGFLKTMYGYKSCRNVCQDSLFLKRLFNSPREEFRKKLWLNVWHLQSEANGNNDFVRNLYSVCGMDFLTSSLKFTYSEGKENIVHNGRFFDLLGCLCNMLNPTMNPKIFLDFTDFTKPFLGVLNLWLNMPNLQIDKLFQLTSALLTLFVEDVKIYNEFQEDGIEELFEHNFMRMLIFYPLKPLHCIESLKSNVALDQIPLFSKLLKDSQRKAKWVTALLGFMDIIQWQTVGNYSRGEIENRFCHTMFEVWGVDWFITSLNFRDDYEKGKWCKFYFREYLDKLLRVWVVPGNLSEFVKSPGFLNTFLDIGKLRLENIHFCYEWHVSEYFRLSFAFICLICLDKKIYDDFRVSLQALFENAFKQLMEEFKSEEWNVLELLTKSETDNRLQEFDLKVNNCNWKPKWATDFLKIINNPLQTDKNYSVRTHECYLAAVYLEIISREDIENEYCNKIFEKLGVNGFTKSLSFIHGEEGNVCCIKFKNYLGNLLKVWKTPGNLAKFVKSTYFVKLFRNTGKLRLQNICFYDGSEIPEFFRLSLAVIWMFDSDKKLYDDYVSLQPLFENASTQLIHSSEKLDVREILSKSETEGDLKEFELKVTNCKWKSKWATDFLKIIQEPQRSCTIF